MAKLVHHLRRHPTRRPHQITLQLLQTWARLHLQTIHPHLLHSVRPLRLRLRRLCTAQLLQCTAQPVPLTVAALVSTSNHLLHRTILLLLQASARRARHRQQVRRTLRPVPCTTAVLPRAVRVLAHHTLPQVRSTRLIAPSTRRLRRRMTEQPDGFLRSFNVPPHFDQNFGHPKNRYPASADILKRIHSVDHLLGHQSRTGIVYYIFGFVFCSPSPNCETEAHPL